MESESSIARLEAILKHRQRTENAYRLVIALVIGQFAFLNIFAANQFAELAMRAYGEHTSAYTFGVQLNVGIVAMVLFSFLSLFVLVKFAGDRMKQEKEISELLNETTRRRSK